MDQEFFYDHDLETLSRQELQRLQKREFRKLVALVAEHNPFYRTKIASASLGTRPERAPLGEFPFTTKKELVEDSERNPPYGTNLTYPLQQYVRVHQTSGTTGTPLAVLDTRRDWEDWKRCWKIIFRAAGVQPGDRIFAAFSFGPFVGFWSAFEAIPEIGCLAISGGGQTSLQRLENIFRHQATVLVCTPSYALHLAQTAREHGIKLAEGPVRITLHAGEPGASIPATRKAISKAWGAACFDHVGASEVGPFAFECTAGSGGLHLLETNFICEVIDPETLEPVGCGAIGELVVTSLKRTGYPVIRYRTGDLVRLSPTEICPCGRHFQVLAGGVLGRSDDMITVRGVNVFPSAIEGILREVSEVVEFQGEVYRSEEMDELLLRVELHPSNLEEQDRVKAHLEEMIRRRLSLRIHIEVASPGSLPRYEFKARRFRRVSPR